MAENQDASAADAAQQDPAQQGTLFTEQDADALRQSLDSTGGVVQTPDSGAAPEDPPAQPPAQQAQQQTPPADQQAAADQQTQAQAAASAEETLGIRDAAKEYGIDLSEYQDDAAAMKFLAEQARKGQEQNQLAQYGQEFVKLATDGTLQEYLKWKEEQSKQQQAQQDQPLLWKSDWDPAWEAMLTKDENGNIVPNTAKGGTPDLVQKFYQHQQRQLEVMDRLARDPEGTLDPYVQNRAEQIARQIVQEELGKFGQEVNTREFVLANQNWMYEKDDLGRVKRDGQGNPQLSPDGKVFADELASVQQRYPSMNDEDQMKYAMDQLNVHRERQSQAAQPTPEDKKRETLKQAAGYQPSAGASTTPPSPARSEEHTQDQNASFLDMLKSDFKKHGLEPHHDLIEA